MKLELKPDLAVEISTGNTSEISTELRSKSAFLGRNSQISTLKSVAGRNFYGSQILKIEKYGISASFCTLNQYRSPKTRKSRARQSWWILSKNYSDFGFWKFSVWHQKSQNPPTLTSARFSSFRAMTLIQSAK